MISFEPYHIGEYCASFHLLTRDSIRLFSAIFFNMVGRRGIEPRRCRRYSVPYLKGIEPHPLHLLPVVIMTCLLSADTMNPATQQLCRYLGWQFYGGSFD